MASTQSKVPPKNLEVRHTTWNDEDGIKLRARQRVEISAGGYASEPGAPPSAADVPIFIVILKDGLPVACGGLRPLPDDPRAAEIKRMYTLPEARGRSNGVSDLMVLELEKAALARGWTIVRIETARAMVHARRFYERNGFAEIQRFGQYVDAVQSVYYEKVLGTG